MKYLDYPAQNTLDEVSADPTNYLSVDFEFTSKGPYRVGLSRGGKFVSLPMNNAAKREIINTVNSGGVLVGHNMLGADRPFITDIVGHEVPLTQYDDTLIYFYLTHAHYCKMVKSEEDGDAGRGIGLYDLWSMSSLYTDLPQWKRCRDGLAWNDAYAPPLHCSGPCPVHDHNWYNGVDALAVDLTYPQLIQECERKKIPLSLIGRMKQLTDVCEKMQARGVWVDQPLVRRLEAEFDATKDRLFEQKMIAPPCGVCGRMKEPPCKKCREGAERKKVKVWDAPFAPTSPKQITKYFASQGVSLGDTSKDEIEKAIDTCESNEAREWLGRLYDYKQAGKGLKAWFDDRYVDSNTLVHPRFNPCGTSTGRLASSNPNFQNIPKVGFGKKVRAAIIPRDKSLILTRADFKQLEFRMVLWYAYHYILKQPYPGVSGDAFTWLVENSNGAFAEAARIMQRDERSVAKSIVHAADYLEGVRSYSSNDIRSERFKQDVSKGSIVLYNDWIIDGKYIGFTGVNLARRLFGSATADNRRKALTIQETYFNAYPFIRQWHKSLSHWVEKEYVRSHTGRYLKLFGSVEERLKDCAAFLGQGGGADYVQEAMIASTETPLMQIHDELLYERPRTLSNAQHLEFMKDTMERDSRLFEGFRCPIDSAIGENWLEMEML